MDAAGIYACAIEVQTEQMIFSNNLRMGGAFPQVNKVNISSSGEEIRLGEMFDVRCEIDAQLFSVSYQVTFYVNRKGIGQYWGMRNLET